MNTAIKIRKNLFSKRKFKISTRQLQLQSMILPGVIFLLIFEYFTYYGMLIAFQDYNVVRGFFSSPWVGFKHFKFLFSDPNMFLVLKNSLAINLLQLIFAFPAPIIFALLINEVPSLPFKKATQTISYLPHFVSWVIFGGMIIKLLSPDEGAINEILMALGILKEPVLFMAKPEYFWFIVVLAGIIKGTGWGSILYIAAISGVDTELYDAATVDGAGRFAKMRYVTLPSISLTIMIMLIFEISRILNTGFDRIWIFQNFLNISTSEVFETYTYKIGIEKLKFSYGTAVGLTKSVVSVVLLTCANFASRKLTENSLF